MCCSPLPALFGLNCARHRDCRLVTQPHVRLALVAIVQLEVGDLLLAGGEEYMSLTGGERRREEQLLPKRRGGECCPQSTSGTRRNARAGCSPRHHLLFLPHSLFAATSLPPRPPPPSPPPSLAPVSCAQRMWGDGSPCAAEPHSLRHRFVRTASHVASEPAAASPSAVPLGPVGGPRRDILQG